MAKKITIANSKGGVGKTTVSSMLAFHLAKKGYKVLMVDFDPQSNTTQLFQSTYSWDTDSYVTLYDGIKDDDLSKAVQKLDKNLHLIPSAKNTAAFIKLLTRRNQYTLLKTQIEKIESNYDFIFYDVPPTIFTEFTNNALTASDYFIILTETTRFSFNGIPDYHYTAEEIQQKANPSLDFLGILVNMREDDEEINQELDEEYNFSDTQLFFQTQIPRRKRLAKYMSNGMYKKSKKRRFSIIKHDRWDRDIIGIFENLTKEFLEKVK